jgi:DNA-binding SARP family transcriptional activator/Flp pilus assembly protein TadD
MAQLAARFLRLLGPTRVERIQKDQDKAIKIKEGDIPRFRSRRTIGLLGYLASERRPIAREFLAALFWPDETPAKGRGNLRRELHNLAQILPDCWELDRQAVTFVPSSDTSVDIDTFLELLAGDRWVEAAETLGGDFLEGLSLDDNLEFENWLLGERERWRGHGEEVLIRVIDGRKQRGQYADAIHFARRLLQLTPWNEYAHQQLMRLLAWTGQRGAALRQFEKCKEALWEELSVKPSEETITLYQQIEAAELDVPPQLPAFLTEEGARHKVEQPLFVAREGELARLNSFLNEAMRGQGRVTFVTGGPGRGKTALLDAFARRSVEAHSNLLVATGSCNAFSGIGDPYLPFRDVMAMLTGDVEAKWDAGTITRDHAQRLWAAFPVVLQALLDHGPQLMDVLVPGAALLSRTLLTDQAGAFHLPRLRALVNRQFYRIKDLEQRYLFQQLTNVLQTVAQEQPLLLILDDIQWADAASIGLLFHLGRRIAEVESRILIACAYRPEELTYYRDSGRHPLAKVMSEFKRAYGDVWVGLGAAEGMEDREFVDAFLDTEPNLLAEEFRAALFRCTEGHPLFTIELLRAMQDRGDLLKDHLGHWVESPMLDWDLLPARVEAVIEDRINRLEPDLIEIISTASVEGEVFTAQVITEVQKLPERHVLRWLSEELERTHRLVREQEEVHTRLGRLSRYRFGHVLFQQYLYKRISPGERRLLHRDVAIAIEKLYEGQLDEMAVQLGHHFHNAGDDQRAYHYFSVAAERAALFHANDEAITHYTQAIELADRISLDDISLAKLYHSRGLAFGTVGEFKQARTDLETALGITRATDEYQMACQALLDLGRLWASRDHNQTREYFETALELARRLDDPAILATSLNWMGNWCANDENPKRAVAYHKEALDIFEGLADRGELANTLDLLGVANLLGSDLSTSVQYYDQAIALYHELDDRPGLTTSLIGRAFTFSMLVFLASVAPAPAPDATFDFDEALRIAGEIGSAPDEAWAHWSLGLFYTIHGQFGDALKFLQRGLRIASEIGHREWVVSNRFALGILYTELFAHDQARQHLEEAMTLARELRSPHYIHLVIGVLAGTYILMDDQKAARAYLDKVLSPQTLMDTLGTRYCWVRRAELALLDGDPSVALDITERLIASAPGLSQERVITFLWKLKGEALAALGQVKYAISLLHAALENAHAQNERFLLWRVHASLGQIHSASNRKKEAQEAFSSARELINELAATIPDQTLKDNFLQGAYKRLDLS